MTVSGETFPEVASSVSLWVDLDRESPRLKVVIGLEGAEKSKRFGVEEALIHPQINFSCPVEIADWAHLSGFRDDDTDGKGSFLAWCIFAQYSDVEHYKVSISERDRDEFIVELASEAEIHDLGEESYSVSFHAIASIPFKGVNIAFVADGSDPLEKATTIVSKLLNMTNLQAPTCIPRRIQADGPILAYEVTFPPKNK